MSKVYKTHPNPKSAQQLVLILYSTYMVPSSSQVDVHRHVSSPPAFRQQQLEPNPTYHKVKYPADLLSEYETGEINLA